MERGRRDTDELVAFCGLQPSRDRTLLEIGAGAGRMTHRFVELYGRVIALDVSDEMLRLGRRNLVGVGNVEWVLGSGTDLDVLADRSVDEVFSYITLQHVPTSAVVLRYLEEAGRVLRPGGRGALQVRHPGEHFVERRRQERMADFRPGGRPRRSSHACRPGPPGLVGCLARHPHPDPPTTPCRFET